MQNAYDEGVKGFSMSRISNLFTVVVSFSILGVSAILAPAQADILKEETGWVMSEFGNAGSSNGFCAMAKGYTMDTVLTIARNNKGESSIAIESDALNLQTNTLQAVVLRSGRAYLSSFDVRPASPYAFVLKVGKDGPLFEALSKNQEMNISTTATTLTMPMPDITQALGELSRCAGPVTLETPKPKAVPMAPIVEKKDNPKEVVEKVVEKPIEKVIQEPVQKPADPKKGQIPALLEYQSSAEPLPSQPAPVQRVVSNPEPSIKEPVPAVAEETTPMVMPKYVERDAKALEQDMLAQVDESAKARPSMSARQERLLDGKVAKPQSVVPAREVAQMQAVPPTIEAAPVAKTAYYDTPYRGGEVDRLREENLKLSRALADVRRKYENASMSAVDDNVMRDMTDRVDILARENRLLRGKLEADEQGREFLDMASELAKMQTREKNLLVQIQEQKEKLELAEVQQTQVSDSVEVAALKEENTRLRNALSSIPQAIQSGTGVTAVLDDRSADQMNMAYNSTIQSLERQVKQLEAKNKDLQVALQNNQSGQPVAPARNIGNDTAAQQELKKLKRRYEQAEYENRRMGKLLASARQNEEREVVAQALPSRMEPVAQETLSDAPNERIVSRARTDYTPTPSVSEGDKVSTMLKNANILASANVQKLENVSRPGFSVYQWESNGTYGTIEVTKAAGAQVMDTLQNAYLEKTRRRCQGSFEAVPSEVSSSQNAISYDIACVDGPNSNAVAALYFVYDGHDFMTFALETTIDSFADAMSLRDKIAQSNS